MMGRVETMLTVSNTFTQVDAMLQNLEKEIDDVDAKIGDRWRLLDRCLIDYHHTSRFIILWCMFLYANFSVVKMDVGILG